MTGPRSLIPGRILRKAAAAAVIAAVLLLALRAVKGPRGRGELQALRIGIQDNAITSLVVIAEVTGCFERNGLDVELVRYPSGKLALMGMLDGEVDIATCADIPIMSHSFKRDDFRAFGSIAHTDRGAWLVARKDHGIATVEDLRGKRIATQENSAVHFFLCMFLLHSDIDQSDVRISYLKAVDLPGALVAGDIDAFSMRNPFALEARQALGDRVIEFFKPGIYTQTFNLVARKDYLGADPERARRVIAAVVDAEKRVRAGKEKALATAITWYGSGRAAEVRRDWDTFVLEVGLEQSLLLTLEDQARWAQEQGLARAGTIPNYLDYIYLDAVEAVKPEAVTVIR